MWTTIVITLMSVAPLPPAEVVTVAPGVTLLIHPDASPEWPQGNTVVIEGEDGLLVVDSAFLPSSARSDVAILRRLFPKKAVRYLLNTHWHYDHIGGNGVYREAFPEVEIVSHAATRPLLEANVHGFMRRWSKRSGEEAEKLRAKAKPDANDALRLAEHQRQREEFERFRHVAPTMTFERGLTLHLGVREVRLLHPGRGNTPGDVALFLPKERILIAGDLVVAPVPFTFNSYPSEWVASLRALAALEPLKVIPGHGRPLEGTAYLEQVASLLEEVRRRVRVKAEEGLLLDEVRAQVSLADLERTWSGGDPAKAELFRDAVTTPLVERAFREAKGQQ